VVLRDPFRAAQMAAAGRARALDRFAMERHTTEFEQLLAECAAHGSDR
jgi:hypothetical protein